jgi:hypothetical protein
VPRTWTPFRDYPLNAQNLKEGEGKKKDGFTMVTGRKHHPPRKQTQENAQKIPTKNSYDILNQLLGEEEVGDPHKKDNQEKEKGKAKNQAEPGKETNQDTNPTRNSSMDKPEESGDTLMQLDEQDLET